MPPNQADPKKPNQPTHPFASSIDFSKISDISDSTTTDNIANNVNKINPNNQFLSDSTQSKPNNPFKKPPFFKKFYIRKSVIALSIFAIIGITTVSYCAWRFSQEGPEFIVSILKPQPKHTEQITSQTTKLLCEDTIITQDLITYGNATSGTKRFEIIFQEGKLDQIIMTSELTYSDFSTAHTSLDKVKSEYEKTLTNITQDKKSFNAKYTHKNGIITTYHSIAAEQINDKNANFFEFPTENNQPIQDFNQIRRHYSKPSGSYNCQRQGARITQYQPQSQPQNQL